MGVPTGTSPSGYNADSLTSHPDDITSLPSLMAFSAKGNTLPAVAAYQAYRRGARQTFAGGSTILYRRSNTKPNWLADSAGLPDVVLGVIGLSELLTPGIIDRIIALDMSGSGIQIKRQGTLLELSWPLIGNWYPRESTNLTFWTDLQNLPNPYLFSPFQEHHYFRIVR